MTVHYLKQGHSTVVSACEWLLKMAQGGRISCVSVVAAMTKDDDIMFICGGEINSNVQALAMVAALDVEKDKLKACIVGGPMDEDDGS